MSVYLRKNSAIFWCKFYVRGECIRLSTGKTARREALKEERRLRAEAEAKPAPSRVAAKAGSRLSDLAAADMERAEIKDTSEIHRKVLGQRWVRIMGLLGGERHPADITAAVLGQYVKDRKAEGLKNQTIKREVADLRRVLLEAVETGLISALPKPWPALKNEEKDAQMAGKLHDKAALETVLAAVPDDVRDAARFCYATGLRFGELRRVSIDWLTRPAFDSEVPYLLRMPAKATKSRKTRIVGVTQEIADMLFRRAKDLRSSLIFPRANYRKALHTACRKVGYPQTITLRDLRHMFASEALKRSGNIKAVSQALGHSVSTTTELYLHAEDRDVAALAALVPSIAGTATRAQPGMGTALVSKKPSFLGVKMEPIGIEPTTSGLQTAQVVDFVGESDPGRVENSQQDPEQSKGYGHNARAQRSRGHSEPFPEPVSIAEMLAELATPTPIPFRMPAENVANDDCSEGLVRIKRRGHGA